MVNGVNNLTKGDLDKAVARSYRPVGAVGDLCDLLGPLNLQKDRIKPFGRCHKKMLLERDPIMDMFLHVDSEETTIQASRSYLRHPAPRFNSTNHP